MTTSSLVLLWMVLVAAFLLALVVMVRWLRSDRVITNAFRQASEGDFDGAVVRLTQAADQADPYGTRREALGFLYFQRAKWPEAAEAFAKAAEHKTDNVIRRVYQAHAMARAGRLEEAKSLLCGLSEARPNDVAPLCGMALVLVEAGDVPAAAERYWKARQLFQQHPNEQTSAGMGLLEQCAQTISRNVTLEARSSQTPATQVP